MGRPRTLTGKVKRIGLWPETVEKWDPIRRQRRLTWTALADVLADHWLATTGDRKSNSGCDKG